MEAVFASSGLPRAMRLFEADHEGLFVSLNDCASRRRMTCSPLLAPWHGIRRCGRFRDGRDPLS
jgi:hypothetical protein